MRSRPRRVHQLWFVVLGICLGLAAAVAGAANIQKLADPGNAYQRPLSDFLSAQGSTSGFFPPLPDFVAWTNNNPLDKFAAVDYTGLVGDYLASHGGPNLGTRVNGTVMERPLADGRAEVTVNLHVVNALTWVTALPAIDLATDPPLYGYRGGDLLANPSLTPALSTCEMKLVLINTAPGDPLPDLIPVLFGSGLPGQEVRAVLINASGSGPLRPAAGVPDGTPGRFSLINNGVFHASGKGGTADGFPAEVINLRPAGPSFVASGREFSKASASGDEVVAPPQRTSWARVKALYH